LNAKASSVNKKHGSATIGADYAGVIERKPGMDPAQVENQNKLSLLVVEPPHYRPPPQRIASLFPDQLEAADDQFVNDPVHHRSWH
jgi:hypothetical protein